MPTPTDLVTDLPADFEVFGQAVDTTLADLKGGTSGQVLAKASATDMDFTWTTPEIGDITNITATSPLTGGGSSGAVTVGIQAASTTQSGAVQLTDSTASTSTTTAATPNSVKSAYDLANTANTTANTATTTANAAIPKSTVTTAGDVIYATGSSAVTRLGIGTAGQVLTVNGGGTAPSWATPASSGGMTLLSTTTLTGTSNSISVSASAYKDLKIYIYGCNNGTDYDLYVRLNSLSTTSYWQSYRGVHGASTAVNLTASRNGIYLNGFGAYALKSGNTDNSFNMTIADCNSAQKKIVSTFGAYMAGDAGTSQLAFASVDSALTSSAVTNVTVIASTSFTAGTCQIYGVK